jgi:hypothetical protein
MVMTSFLGQKPPSVFVARVCTEIDTGCLYDLTKRMKEVRETAEYTNVIATFDFIPVDSPELVDIPEVRAECRRLLDTGFASYLDHSTQIPPGQLPEIRCGLGFAEVYLIANNRLRPGIRATAGLMEEVRQAMFECNAIADSVFGPMAK